MLLASFAEVVSIGAILPFLSVLTAPSRVFDHHLARPLIHALGLTEPKELLLPLTIIFGLAAILSGAMRLILLWTQTQLSNAIGADLSLSVYRRTLYQSYEVHISRNSSEVIAGISNKVSAVMSCAISPVLIILSSSLILMAILIALMAVEPIVALSALVGFGLIYALVMTTTKKRLARDGQRISREQNLVIKAVQEGLGGIRDVLIDGTQATYCDIYRNADLPLRRANANIQILGSSPRYAIEALGVVLIASLALLLAGRPAGIVDAIPVLGALALGAQRMLPALQQLYSSWTVMLGGQASLQDALELLDQPLPDYADRPAAQPLPFRHQIRLNQLTFRYTPQTPLVLSNLNLTITKGSRVGFIGTTGSGKSTLLDIVMGLLRPTDGTLEIDGQPVTPGNNRGWQAHIAHVPQAIFLADSTIEENIAFGVPKDQIDATRVRQAAQQAQIADIIETWPKQYQTFVGERGIRLSGGQRQRIGIARALYKKADVIIFDEATSALDNETEQAVMQAIEGLSKELTLLIIAHRLTTLKNCTHIVELGDGGIKRAGTYQDIVNQAE